MVTRHQKESHHQPNWCSAPEPYPVPRAERPNLYYAMLLLEDYTGVISEFTAATQYFHHSLRFQEGYDDLAELLECISITEMLHMQLLGETIQLLGSDPKFRTITENRPDYWQATYVYYGEGLYDRLSADIAAEISAIKQYRHHQQIINDCHVKELLGRIILDEECHLQLFREAAKKYCGQTEEESP
ncbi:Hypothetical protein LUCI_0235 [Lucifera butyrica]|uniref:Ferritin/DPS domain-containing protein n=1 Tax=Lucifera butyrica TaxID=1351585 RepID=A0A498R1E3_9FIRM|nr:manganese catalase family protein [Lucifera butyrica]VBB05029.1 Hypothetical protein LUCI_0235 [Lucifera butyrica]